MRFVVTELEGWLGEIPTGRPKGLSCHVIDTAWNHRLIATYRTDGGVVGMHRIPADVVRRQASDHAARLNAALDR